MQTKEMKGNERVVCWLATAEKAMQAKFIGVAAHSRCALKLVKWCTCWRCYMCHRHISVSMRTWINWNSQSIAFSLLKKFFPSSLHLAHILPLKWKSLVKIDMYEMSNPTISMTFSISTNIAGVAMHHCVYIHSILRYQTSFIFGAYFMRALHCVSDLYWRKSLSVLCVTVIIAIFVVWIELNVRERCFRRVKITAPHCLLVPQHTELKFVCQWNESRRHFAHSHSSANFMKPLQIIRLTKRHSKTFQFAFISSRRRFNRLHSLAESVLFLLILSSKFSTQF